MDDDADSPVPLSLVADLQAGLLDDDAAAVLRRRARTDPQVAGQLAALDRVRRDLAALGADAASAPEVPPAVAARVGTALRSLPASSTGPVAGRSVSGWRAATAVAGVLATLAAAGIGSAVLLRNESPGAPADDAIPSSTSAPRAPGGVPLRDDEILGLLTRPVDPGPLAAPQRLASCLSGLGYPASASPLGARPLLVNGRPGVLLLLPGDVPRRIDAIVVAPNCSSIDTGLLASTVLNQP
jgi:hypothetical protein